MYPFEIVGILEDEQFRSHTRKALAIDDRAQEIYIPYTTSMRTFGTATWIERGGTSERSIVELDQLIVVAKEAAQVWSTSRVLSAILKNLHKKRGLRDRHPARAARAKREDPTGVQRRDGLDRRHLALDRRDRYRQHHVGDDHRTHQGDRHPPRHGRAPARHRAAVPDRDRRHRRRRRPVRLSVRLARDLRADEVHQLAGL